MRRNATTNTRAQQFSLHALIRTFVACLTFFTLLAFATFATFAALTPLPAFAANENENNNLVDPTQRADNSFIYDTTIESLTEQAALYNDRTVQIVGEVIGDCITSNERGSYWITLTVTDTEDKSSISVLLSEEQTSQIDHYGKYGVTGTILQVRGTYHQACNEHDGLPDVHATNSSVISRGVNHPDVFNPSSFTPGIVALIIGGILLAVFYFARERMR